MLALGAVVGSRWVINNLCVCFSCAFLCVTTFLSPQVGGCLKVLITVGSFCLQLPRHPLNGRTQKTGTFKSPGYIIAELFFRRIFYVNLENNVLPSDYLAGKARGTSADSDGRFPTRRWPRST